MTHDETAEPTPEQADAVPVDETSTPAVSAPEPQPILVTPPPEPQARGALNLLRRITTRRPAAGPTNLYVTAPPPPAPATSVTEISLRQPFAIGFFATMGALVAVGLWGALTSLQSIIIIIVLSLFIALGLNPMVEWLTRRGVPRGVAVFLVMIGVLLVVGLAATALLPVVSSQGTLLYKNAPVYVQSLRDNEQLANLDAQYHFISRIQEALSSGNLINTEWSGLLGAGKVVVNAVFSVIVTMVLTAYFLASLPQIKSTIYALSPGSRRERAKFLADEVFESVGGYVTGMTIDVMIAGVVFFVFLFVVGLGQYALALAFMVALLTYIPLIGGITNIVVVSLVGFSQSLGTGIACLVFCILYQQVDSYFTQPRLMARAVKLPGALVVVAALAGGTSLGITGAVMAVPIAATLLLLYREVVRPTLDAR